MIKPNFKIICHIPDKNKPVGYLLLMHKGRQNRKRISTGIRIDPDKFIRFWNADKQQFKSGLENYKVINQQIEKVIEDNTKDNGKDLAPPVKVIDGSFLKYWTSVIDTEITKQGSKVKHTTVKKKLEKYLSTIKKTDLYFTDLTPTFIKQVHSNFKTDTSLATNSVNSYMKLINNIIRRKMKDDPYTFTINPFVSVTYERKEHAVRKVLDERELNFLFNTKIEDDELDLVRDMYLFQIFASGMRVSDLCLLRWGNIIYDVFNEYSATEEPLEPRLEYVMYKTREPIGTPFTFYT